MTEKVKGFQDFFGEEAKKRAEIKKLLVETFETFGFEPAETPLIEYEKFVKGNNSNDEAVSDIFKLKDKGKRNLALRYEFTFQLKRLMENKKLPYRRYQIGEVFRDEPVSSNRFRQFTQCDVDIVSSDEKEEAEILSITKNVLDKLNIKFEININNRGLLNEILEEQKVQKKIEVIREIDKLDKLSEKEVKKNLGKYGAEKILDIFNKPEKYFERYSFYNSIKKLRKYCKYYGIKIKFQPSLARGLSYYNGNVFEIKTKKMKETVCAGGSYKFNEQQCTGISFGLERLCKIAKINLEKDKYLIISLEKDEEAIKLANKLRENGKMVSIYYGKPSKALEYANSYDYSYAIFIGKKEIENKELKIKNLKTGKEEILKI